MTDLLGITRSDNAVLCRFEQLALEYDSDELGELDDVEGGGAGFGLSESTLQTCIAEQSVRMPLIEGPHSAQAPLPAGNHRQGDADRRIAIEKVREDMGVLLW